MRREGPPGGLLAPPLPLVPCPSTLNPPAKRHRASQVKRSGGIKQDPGRRFATRIAGRLSPPPSPNRPRRRPRRRRRFSPLSSLGEPFLRRTGSPKPPPKTFTLAVPRERSETLWLDKAGFRSPIRNPNRRPAFSTALPQSSSSSSSSSSSILSSFSSGGTFLEENRFPQTPSKDLYIGGALRAQSGGLVRDETIPVADSQPESPTGFLHACGGQVRSHVFRQGM